jgi:GTP-binding protein
VSDSDFDPEDIEKGRKLFTQECSFVLGVASLEGLPPEKYPEIVFAGRSNVGKSSLINALTFRKSLARTSRTPGRTQQLNFFELAKTFYLVDLPGYGYAKASKKEIKSWTDLMGKYLRGRSVLRRVYILIDGRHGLKSTDREFMADLDKQAVSYQIILTKCDKQTQQSLKELEKAILTELKTNPASHPSIISTSVHKNMGLEDLRAEIAKLVD